MNNKVFLDNSMTSLLTEYLLKNNYINRYYDKEPISQFANNSYKLKGIKKLFVILSLYEDIDFVRTNYDYDNFCDMCDIKYKKIDYIYSKENVEDALLLLKLDSSSLKNKYYRENPVCNKKEFENTLINIFIPYATKYSYMGVDKIYNNLINKIMSEQKCLNLNSLNFIYENVLSLAIGLSDKNDIYTDIFKGQCDKNDIKDKIDSMYYVCRVNLPTEVNILPAPQTLADVINLRKSPYVKSFRNVFQEWMSYIDEENITLAKKIEKDVVKANNNLTKLDKYYKFSKSPFVRTCVFAGGFIPVVSEILNIATYAGGIIDNELRKRYEWILISNKH